MKEIFVKDKTHILYDNATSFEPLWLDLRELDKKGWLVGTSTTGRVPACFFQAEDNNEYCLKRYCRGGLAKHITKDKYIYLGKDYVRSFAELKILRYLRKRKLPVPTPVAASFSRAGIFYRASILISSCRPALPLSEVLMEQRLDASTWMILGDILRKLHKERIYHTDLNAYNVLYDVAANQFWLIDFDCAYQAKSDFNQYICKKNINHLHRSLKKLLSNTPKSFHYDKNDFDSLLQGYDS